MYIGQRYISQIEKSLFTFFNVFLHMGGQESLKFLVLSSYSSYDTGFFLY